MSYVKNTWQTGDTITATGLNHMEDGIADAGGGGALIVNIVDVPEQQTVHLDKTWKEIKEAILAGANCWCSDTTYYDNCWTSVARIYEESGNYVVGIGGTDYSTNNENGYPSSYYGD